MWIGLWEMKVCYLIDTLAIGGSQNVAVVTAIELARRGHKVVVLRYYSPNDFEEHLRSAGVQSLLAEGERMRRLAGLRKAFKRERFDVIHAFSAGSAIWGLFASAGIQHARRISGHHSLWNETRLVRTLCRAMRPWVKTWVVPSEAAARVTRRAFSAPDKAVHVVPNPVNIGRFTRTRSRSEAKAELGIEPAAPVVAMIANLWPWKNHRMLFNVAEALKIRGGRPLFLLVGKDYMQGALQREAEHRGLDERFRFLGHRKDVERVLEAADLVVMTSFKESFCLGIAEAGAMGLPCVSTDNGGVNEIIQDGEHGFIVGSEDSAAMAMRIEELLGDQAMRIRLGENLRRRVVGHFAPEVTTTRLLEIYASVE